jgi:nucleolar protein 58
MYVLFETAGGFALFKVLKEKKLDKIDKLHQEFETAEQAS